MALMTYVTGTCLLLYVDLSAVFEKSNNNINIVS